ncbi:hypothetical protein [Photobacterium arenosum]|uniref:hypothetical protein n=1 Tax=Photobacterium arenosum TaxID=2774143 RepID=UPI00288A46B3|nr:hypothetical protein [Photobacterium arenosum]
MIVYAYSSTDGRAILQTQALPDLLHPGDFLIPGYHSPKSVPDSNWLLADEYFAYLDENDKPPRRWQDGNWTILKEKVPTTGWLKSDCTQSRQFDDASEVTEDYTPDKPATLFDYWTDSGWQTDQQAKFEAEVKAVNIIRRQKYAQISDPLLSESLMLRELGDDISAEATKQQALEWYQKIKDDHPWPQPLI